MMSSRVTIGLTDGSEPATWLSRRHPLGLVRGALETVGPTDFKSQMENIEFPL